MSGDLRNPQNSLIDQKISSDQQVVDTAKKTPIEPEYQDDYDQIHSAVLETKRGRWFLGEFARKNKQVQSQLVLDALASLETKISDKKPTAQIQQPAAPVAKSDFENKQNSTRFGQIFTDFKQKTIASLKWAGINTDLEFSKIQTVLNFASNQSRASIVTQEKKLNAVIAALKHQNIDSNILNQLNHISSELNKLQSLQSNLNIQLENSMKFASEIEDLSPKAAQKTPKNEQKTAKNEQKQAENELKTAKKQLKTAQNELETLQKQPEKPKIGPAGRIKKMFKIEQTLKVQQAEDLVEPAKAFDEAFAKERLAVEANLRQVTSAENIEKDLQPATEKPTQISAQSEKLAHLGDMMKQVDDIKNSVPKTKTEPEIIIENDFNALNSLALLSKTERTMLFTLQH